MTVCKANTAKMQERSLETISNALWSTHYITVYLNIFLSLQTIYDRLTEQLAPVAS